MANLKKRVTDTIGTLPVALDNDHVTEWIVEGCERLSLLIPFDQAHRYTTVVEVPDPAGLDMRKYRILRPNKAGRYAYPIAAWRIDAIGEGYFQVSEDFPGNYIKDGILHIVPEGGHAEALGIPVITDIETQESIPQIPHVLENGVWHYAAVRYFMGLIDQAAAAIQKDTQTLLEETLGTLPTLTMDTEDKTMSLVAYPADIAAFTDVTFTDAQKENLTVTQGTVPGLQADQIYTKVNVALDFSDAEFRKNEDDIEMLSGELNKLRTRLEKFQAQMADEMNAISSHLRKYDADVGLAMQLGQIDVQRETQRAQINSAEEQFNRRMAVETKLNDYRLKLERFTTLVRKITEQNQSEIAIFTAKIQQMVQVGQLKISEFNTLTNHVFQTFAAISEQKLQYFNARLAQAAANNQATLQQAELYGRNMMTHQQLYGEVVTMYLQSVTPERRAPQPREETDVA